MFYGFWHPIVNDYAIKQKDIKVLTAKSLVFYTVILAYDGS